MNIKNKGARDFRHNLSKELTFITHNKPITVTRNTDKIFLSNISLIEELLNHIKFTFGKVKEDDGSYTIWLNEIDLVDNAETLEKAIKEIAKQLLEYSEEYYNDFDTWHNAKNRKHHYPYVVKVLLKDNLDDIINLLEEVQ